MRQTQLYRSSGLKGRGWWIGCLLALLITGKGCPDKSEAATGKSASEKPAAARVMLKLQDGVLTAHIAAASLQHVLSEISRLSGARIVWLGQREDRQVSVDFTALPLVEALRRLLGPNNFLLMYASRTDEAKLTAIWVSPHKAAAKPTPALPLITPMQPPLTGENESVVDDAESGLEQMLESYLETAAQGVDHDRRIESISALGGLVDHDARIRPLLQQLSSTESDPQVRAAASEALGEVEE